MKITATVVAFVLGFAVLSADAQAPRPRSLNFLAAIALPTDQQDLLTRQIAHTLAASSVPTGKDAAALALEVIVHGPGLDARESYAVSGLYMMGRGVPQFAAQGDLVWEVQISFLEGLSRVLWVSTTTKTVKVVFP